MATEKFDFSCVVTLRDSTVVEVRQTDIQRDERQGMTINVVVYPHAPNVKPFPGAFRLSGPSLTNLNICAGANRAEQSQHVVEALRAWMRRHRLTPHFVLEVSVGAGNGDPCHVTIVEGR